IFAPREGRNLSRIVQDEHGHALRPVFTTIVFDQKWLSKVLVGCKHPLSVRLAPSQSLAEIAPVDTSRALRGLCPSVDELSAPLFESSIVRTPGNVHQ